MFITQLVVSCMCIFAVQLIPTSDASNILIIFPMPSYSHYTLASRLAEGLVEKGHEVTVIAPYLQENTDKKNYKQLLLEGLADRVREQKRGFFDMESMWPINQIHLCYHLGYMVSEFIITYPPVLDLIKTKKGYYDVVIMDQFYDESLIVFAHELQAPLIHFSTLIPSSWINHLVGNAAPISYIPNIFLDYRGKMDFWDRLHNWFIMITEEVYRRTIAFPYHDSLVKKAFPNAPSLNSLMYDRDNFIFANSHISTSDPVPLLPNIVEIGGFHVKKQKLPEDIKRILDGAKNGVIFFGMGSNLKASLLPKDKKESILKALGRINQTVLWKWEEDHIEGKPENVILRKWYPQQAILAHPNTKAFISHGGLLSTIEAVSFGKPIIGIPIYADQKGNINIAVSRGYALTVPYKHLTEETLYQAIQEILYNSSYSEMAKWRSSLMHDRRLHPLDEAIYWVEHVIRHKGAKHLRAKSMELRWYEYEMIDVALFILLITGILLGGIFYFYRIFLSPVSHKKSHCSNSLGKKQQ